MLVVEQNGLKYLTFERFGNVTHGIFSRHGGVSNNHATSLNVGGTVGDEPGSVLANKQILFGALGKNTSSMFDCWQVHGPDYVLANSPHTAASHTNPREIRADSLLTANPDVTLFMRFADCTPVLLYDPVRRVVGIAHAGWQGTVKHAASNLVRGFTHIFGSDPGDIQAVIGPSIGPCHYEVGHQVIEQVITSYGSKADEMLQESAHGKAHFNMWAANEYDLRNAGVEHIELAGICTACHTNDWFSHRAEKGRTGRFGVIMALPEGME